VAGGQAVDVGEDAHIGAGSCAGVVPESGEAMSETTQAQTVDQARQSLWDDAIIPFANHNHRWKVRPAVEAKLGALIAAVRAAAWEEARIEWNWNAKTFGAIQDEVDLLKRAEQAEAQLQAVRLDRDDWKANCEGVSEELAAIRAKGSDARRELEALKADLLRVAQPGQHVRVYQVLDRIDRRLAQLPEE
jgi:hypothetical protein